VDWPENFRKFETCRLDLGVAVYASDIDTGERVLESFGFDEFAEEEEEIGCEDLASWIESLTGCESAFESDECELLTLASDVSAFCKRC
jgi:hypothetical protein